MCLGYNISKTHIKCDIGRMDHIDRRLGGIVVYLPTENNFL